MHDDFSTVIENAALLNIWLFLSLYIAHIPNKMVTNVYVKAMLAIDTESEFF